MATGTVKFFSSAKGFGFIQPDKGGADVFVHISAIERAGMRTLVEGQKISFEIQADQRSGKASAEALRAVGGGWVESNPDSLLGFQARPSSDSSSTFGRTHSLISEPDQSNAPSMEDVATHSFASSAKAAETALEGLDVSLRRAAENLKKLAALSSFKQPRAN